MQPAGCCCWTVPRLELVADHQTKTGVCSARPGTAARGRVIIETIRMPADTYGNAVAGSPTIDCRRCCALAGQEGDQRWYVDDAI